MSDTSTPVDSDGAPTDDAPVNAPDSDDASSTAPESASAPTADPIRRARLKLAAAGAFVGLGLALMVWGLLSGVTGKDRNHYPAAIESVTPVPDAIQAFGRDSVIVDLADGYTGELMIDDIAIPTVGIGDFTNPNPAPGEQIALPPATVFEPGNSTLTFTPSATAPIEEFSVGTHRVRLTYWKAVDGRTRTRVYNWTFNVI